MTTTLTKVLRPNFEKRGKGLVTVVVQDAHTGDILMVASTDEAGFLETLRCGYAVFWSETRNVRWLKGETSGDRLKIHQILIDCDGDAIIYKVHLEGKGACHTGAYSCFFRDVVNGRQKAPVPRLTKNDELPFIETEVISSILI